MAKIMPQITTSATSTADVPTQKFAGVDAADASKIVVVTSDPTSGDTFDYADPSVIAGGRWQDGDTATDVVLETSTDKVGIGTNSPAKKLHVQEPSGEAEIRLQSGDFSYSSIVHKDTGNELIIQNAATDGVIIFHDDTAERMRITKDGDVGIGSNAPAQKLHVVGNTALVGNVGVGLASPATKLHAYGASGEVELRIQSDTSYTSIVQKDNAELIIQNASSGGVIIFHDDTAERMRIDSAGDVGIGVSDPDTKLEILDAAATQLKLSYDGTDNCTLGVDTYGMLTVTPSGGTITNTAANGVINSAALRTKGAHTHPDTFIKNTHLPVHGSGISNNWLYVSAGKYSNSQLTAPSSGADAIRLIKWQPASAYSDGNTYQIILPSLDATWSSSSNYVSYKIVVQQDTAMGSWSSAVYLQLSGEGGSDTINGSASDYTFDAISGTSVSAKDRTIDVAGYYDGSKTIWEVIRVAQWS